MVLDELGALLLDQDGAGAEVGVVVVGDLGDDALIDSASMRAWGRVVDAARQVAVGGDIDGWSEQLGKIGFLSIGKMSVRCDTTPREAARQRGPPPGVRSGPPLGMASSVVDRCCPRSRGRPVARLVRRPAGPGDLVVARFADGTMAVKRAVESGVHGPAQPVGSRSQNLDDGVDSRTADR